MPKNEDLDSEVHTTVRLAGGLRYVSETVNENVIDATEPAPARKGLRYTISHATLGKLEKLARARFEIRELTPDDVIRWQKGDDEPFWPIAQSVNASSEIEGEEVPASQLELALAAATDPSERRIDEELDRRREAIRSIYDTYVWVLSDQRRAFLSYDYVLEIHRRMFASTKDEVAGRIKDKRVEIHGGGYSIRTLQPEKTEDFLRRLCERANESYMTGEDSRFLITAEFILDFLAIHPFHDGNGRTARLLSTYLLERSGYHFARFYPLDSIILETRSDYYRALFNAQRQWYQSDEDLTTWVEYYTNAVFNQYLRAMQRVKDQHERQDSV